MNPLVGTWRLVSGELRDGPGRPCARFVHGLLCYTAAGVVSAQCAVDDGAAQAPTWYAYYGRYEVDPEQRTVVHAIEKSTLADEEGSRVVRRYELAGDRLTLRFAEETSSGFIILEREETAQHDSPLKRRMERAYTDDYLRILGIEHYRLGYFTPDLAPDDLPGALERYLEVLLDPLEIRPHHTVLDLGCNLGATTSWLVRRYGCTVHAIDVVEDMVQAARDRFAAEGIADLAVAATMDAQRLDFPDRTFDFVLGIEVVHHIPDKAACLRELARVLAPGGQLVLTEYLLEPRAPRLGASFVKMIVESDRLESEAGYRALLSAAGFAETVITDHYRETVVGTNRAFRSDRYRAKVRAYASLYFGLFFAAAMPAVYWLWEQMYRRGWARYVFLYSRI